VDYEALYRRDAVYWWCVGMRAIVGQFVEEVAAGRRLRILDAGCGAGALTGQLQARHAALGVDLTPLALRHAQAQRVRDVTAGSLTALPCASASFDMVLCLDVLYHVGLEDSRQALAEMRRVLRPGGWLLARQPAYTWLNGPHDERLGTRRRLMAGQLRAILTDAGFEVRRVTYLNTLLFPGAALFRLGRRAGLLGGAAAEDGDFLPVSEPVNRLLIGLLDVERRLARRMDLPFGLSALALARRPAGRELPGDG
jgi:SAM-dependent methyltransferase